MKHYIEERGKFSLPITEKDIYNVGSLNKRKKQQPNKDINFMKMGQL